MDKKKPSGLHRPGYELVGFTPYRRLKNGKVIWAYQYGLKAFPIWRKIK